MRGLSYALNTRTSAGYGWIGGVLVKHDVVCVVCCVLCVMCCVLSRSLFSVLCAPLVCATVFNSAEIIRNSNYILPAV